MNPFEGIEVDWMPIIGPIIVLIVTVVAVALIYRLFFNWLPTKLFNFLIGPIVLFGFYIWAIPMNVGFHEFFK
ncbi:hypothetical protein [Sporosarcina psychrophila]|uniref:hypothetical protein n=1 Tax=Sporosarcina psychrophila TaxID=1476 RepID=UPI0009EE97A7|nr:hypothetical protein [Sporosarcina psychrophila]